MRHLFDRTCTLQTAQRVSDGQGGWTTAYGDAHVDVPCRRRPVGGRAEQVADRYAGEVDHVVYVDVAQDVAGVVRVVVDGLTLRLVTTQVPSKPAYRALMCAEIQQTGE